MKPKLSYRYCRVLQIISEDEINISKVFNPYDLYMRGNHQLDHDEQICERFGLHNVIELGHWKHYNYYLTTDPLKPEDCEIVEEQGLATLVALALDDDIKKPFILFHSDDQIYIRENNEEEKLGTTSTSKEDETNDFSLSSD